MKTRMSCDEDRGLEGRMLGDEYVVVGRLPGRGAQISIYEGRHVRLGYRVVVRTSTVEPHSPVATEVDVLSRVRHPALPVALGRGVLDAERHLEYCVRAYAEGIALSSLIRNSRRLEPLRAVRIVRQVLSAAAELHRHGVVHGDIKPENIVVDESDGDRVHLIDFASSVIDGIVGERRGTPRYMAPDLLQGGTPTPASDVFAIGCVLRECLLGEPIHPELREVLTVITARRSVSAEDFASDLAVSPGLQAILTAVLDTEAEPRCSTVAEFALALQTLDEQELATRYLGVFPPSSRVEQETIDLPPVTEGGARSRAHSRDLPSIRSKGRPTVWVLTGAPSIAQVSVQTALAQLAKEVELRFLDEKSRAAIRLGLQNGEVAPPWVLVFGDLHALLGDGLLKDLAGEGETMRVLVSSHANLELAHSTINTTGLDGQICLPMAVKDIMAAITEAVVRCERRRRYYDGLRMAVMDAFEQREQLSCEADLEGM